jgi:hypothetical protein
MTQAGTQSETPSTGRSSLYLALMGNAVAVKKGQIKAKVPDRFQTMGSVRCEGCGEEFLIAQHTLFSSLIVAEHQAHWLERVLADEHEREKKHADQIELPE